jgi:hypothetical protein
LLLIHFDAHPDLAVPTTTTLSQWNDLASLHDALEDDVSGISQFILPLVANGIISTVVWVRSPWSHQLADGRYQFHVGDICTTSSTESETEFNNNDEDNDLKRFAAVTLTQDYYLDDDSYRPLLELDMATAKPIDLTVTTTTPVLAVTQLDGGYSNNTIGAVVDGRRGDEDAVCWILDICLDYFSTLNPFLPQLEAALQRDLSSSASLMSPFCGNVEQALSMIADVFKFMPFRVFDTGMQGTAAPDPRQVRQQCFELLNSLLKVPGFALDGAAEDPPEKRQRRCDDDDVSARFVALYSPPASSSALHNKEDGGQGPKVAIAFLDLLPHLSGATRSLIKEVGSAVLLPDHTSSDQEIDTLISQMTQYLRTVQIRFDTATAPHQQPVTLGPPALITIARSANDGFIPSDVVDRVQARVVAVVQALFHSHWDPRSKLHTDLIIHDLTEDAAARAYTMFLNPIAQQYCTYKE